MLASTSRCGLHPSFGWFGPWPRKRTAEYNAGVQVQSVKLDDISEESIRGSHEIAKASFNSLRIGFVCITKI